MSAVLAALRTIDDALARAGAPPMSPFWRGEGERFYRHPSARLLVECVGRGGDKSRTSVKMAIAEVLAGEFAIPPGERHYFTHVSENREEAAKTLGVLEQYLRILGVPFTRAGDTVELSNMPRGFKVLAARVGAVSGWRCVGWTADECAKWSDEGADPSAEVIASIKAMTVTHPNAIGRMFSSPMSAGGFFHETWSAGDTAAQLAGYAPSWIANPSITEERTRALEPHEPTRQREYGAVPGAGSSDALDPGDVAAMVRPAGDVERLGAPVVVIDSSSGRHDGWSFALVRYAHAAAASRPRDPEIERLRDLGMFLEARIAEQKRAAAAPPSPRVLSVEQLGAFEGKFGELVSFEQVVAHIAAMARKAGASRVYGDQFQSFALQSGFAAHGLAYVERAWSQPTKIESLSTLRRLLREHALVVEPGEQAEALRRELLTLREVLLPSKTFTVQARRTGRGHADRASLLLMVARLVAEGDLFAPREARRLDAAAVPRFIPTRFCGGIADSPYAQVRSVPDPRSGAAPGIPQAAPHFLSRGPFKQGW